MTSGDVGMHHTFILYVATYLGIQYAYVTQDVK